ncbi:MAG TPA: hypothetical protein VI758_09485, partial [Bacteroidota bacterium]
KAKSSADVLELGYEELFGGNGISLIEWADKLGELKPPDRIEIRFSPGSGENERRIEIERFSSHGRNSGMDSGFADKYEIERPGH